MAPSRRGVQQRAEGERPRGERAEPIDVPADGARHEKGAEQSQRVEQRADAQRALLGFERQPDQDDGGERRVEGRADERLRAAFREDDGEDRDGDERREDQQARAHPRGLSVVAMAHASAPSARNAPATGLASAVRTATSSASIHRARCASTSEPSPRARPRSNGTRLESSEMPARREEERPGPRGPRREAAPDRELEQRRRGDHRDGREERGPDRRAERRRDDRVGGEVVAPVPAVVPDREAEAREEVAAVARGSQVGALRSEDQVDDRQQRGERPRRRPAQRRGELARRRGGRSGLRAHPSLRKAATRSTMSGRSSHPQCPASGYSASSPCGSAAA